MIQIKSSGLSFQKASDEISDYSQVCMKIIKISTTFKLCVLLFIIMRNFSDFKLFFNVLNSIIFEK